ncbi:MAG: hypothetical protein ACR2GN_04200 [Bacteroidia bacterium]|jgi:hypothetical protein
MNIHSEKIKLIEWLISLKDEAVIEKLNFFRDNINEGSDWWDFISEDEKNSIKRGLEDLNKGNTITHEEARKKYKKWL